MIFDIITVAILLLYVYFGYRNGFFKALMGFASIFIAIALTMVFYQGVYEWAMKTEVAQNIRESIYTSQSSQQAAPDADEAQKYPSVVKDFIMPSVDETMDAVANTTTDFIMRVGVAILLFLLIFLAIKIVGPLIDSLFKLPVLNLVNKTAGLLLGAFNGWIIILILCCVVTYLVTTGNEWCAAQMKSSTIAVWFYNNNFLLRLF